jgi:glycosyltransferase involved in cell wall biosynthesis
MKKSQLTLSIVIPAYNEEHHLRACLESIARQTIQPDEVVLVDNNSHDRTAEIAKNFTFVRVVHEDRQGLVFARNRGFDEAKSDIIGRIDADTVLPTTWVEHVKAFYANPHYRQMAWSGAGYFYNVRLPRLVAWTYQLLAFRLNKLLIGHYTLWGSNMAILRPQWLAGRNALCQRTDIHEDLDLAMHVAEAGFAITYDPFNSVRAELRRVHTNRHQLWEYLQWWPRTLQVHNKKTWLVCWFFGAFLLYIATFVLLFLEMSGQALEKLLLAPTENPNMAPQDTLRD